MYKFKIEQSKNIKQKIQETLFSNGNDYFDALIHDIASAKKSIYIETFIFKNDILGKKLIKEINKKAADGVKIKILVDGAGSPYFLTDSLNLNHKNIQTKIFHPFPWHFWNWSRSVVKLPSLLKCLYLILMIPRRNHRKVCIIDSKTAYLGSFNITKNHLGQNSGGDNWRDTGIRISNTNLSELESAFDSCWHHRTIHEYLKEAFLNIRKDPVIRLNNTRHRRRILYKKLLNKIKLSKQSIWITNAYFIPENRVLKKLKDAAKRGVSVKILIPRKSDTFLPIPWATSLFYKSLLQSKVEIFEYLPSILHAKSIIIDDWILVGSSNLDYLSLKHNLEVDIRITHQKTKEEVINLFKNDLAQSHQLSIQNWKLNHPWYKRFIGRIILYFKYFI
jgi:cardiolipin synthase A/B